MGYESAYVREIEERDRLRSGAGITIGLLTVLGSGLISLIDSPPIAERALFWLFTVGAGAAGVSFLWGAFCVAMTFYGHIYTGPQTPVESEKFRAELQAYYAARGEEQAAIAARFEAWREEQFAQAAHRNFYVNRRRNAWLYYANIAAMILAGFTLVSFGASKLGARRTASVERVEVVNWPGGTTMSPDPSDQGPPPAVPTTTPAPATPAAPTDAPPAPPPLHEFRGGRDVVPNTIRGTDPGE